MLQRLRDSFFGPWVLGIVIGLIAVTFIFFGVDPSLTQTTFAAKVNGENIPLEQFDLALQAQQRQYQQLYRTELTDDLRRQLRANVLERLVQEEALKQRVDDAGYRVSDERLTEFIRSVPAFQINGEFSMEVYEGLLTNQGIVPASFEEDQREQLEVLELQTGVAESAILTPAEFRRYIELYNQGREIAYALFDVETFMEGVEIDEAAITAHYEANQASFRTEETVDLEYIELAQSDIASSIEATEEALRSYYEEERERFETPEERRARHILIEIDGDEADARAEAERVLARVQGGEDFAAVAADASDDPGTGAQGGDLGWIARGMLTGPFEDALFEMEAGEIRGPVQSQFGFHVIRLDEARGGEVQPFEAARDELLAEFQTRRATDLFYERANELADLAFDAYDELASVAMQMGLDLKTLEDFPRSGNPLVFPESAPIVQAAFAEEVVDSGRNSSLVELGEDHVLVLRVTDHRPSTVQPLETVREEVVQELTRSRAQDLADAAAAAFRSELAAGGDPIALAEAHRGTWHPPVTVERTSADLPTEVLSAAFALPKPAAGEVVRENVGLANGASAVLVLSNVAAGQAESIPSDDREQRRQQLADQTAAAEITAYAGDLRDRATVRIPDEILNPTTF